ncbi:MAG TPA: signal peptide peptidase SppA [Thermoanaerobaculia bacterium]|nr:signal peptide peptidase SppA [Thermoanaerobaculia bacterium]
MSETEPVIAVEPPQAAPPPSPAAPRKSRAGSFFLGAFTGCLLVLIGFFLVAIVIAAARGQNGGAVFSTQKVAIIPVDGEILEARDTIELLHRYADSSTVRALVMRINSPGGAVAPSQEIYEEIRKVREQSGKPIVASVDNVAASGAFYIASACDEIVSNPGSITGSIGVILQWFEVKDLLNWAKVHPETITSGAMKDTGSPFRAITPAERDYLQSITNQLHAQFVHAVAVGRKGKISEEDVARIADGRIFTGEQALQLKLIDRLGNLDDAVLLAGSLAGIHGKPATIYPRKRTPTLLDLLSGSSADSEALLDRALGGRAGFFYRW